MHHALRSIRLGHFAKTVTIGSIGLLLLLLLNAAAQAGPAEVDDGWRRTRFGWENIKDWDLIPEQRELPSATPLTPVIVSPAADTLFMLLHPGVLALGLSVLAVTTLHLATPRELACDDSVSIDVQPGSAV